MGGTVWIINPDLLTAKIAETEALAPFEQLSWFARHVDECLIFDNSTGEPDLIGGLRGAF